MEFGILGENQPKPSVQVQSDRFAILCEGVSLVLAQLLSITLRFEKLLHRPGLAYLKVLDQISLQLGCKGNRITQRLRSRSILLQLKSTVLVNLADPAGIFRVIF